MPLMIPDETLRAMRLDERQARIEIACRLFEAGRLAFGHAAKLADLSEQAMHEEIERRGIPRYRYTARDLENDIETLGRIKAARQPTGK